MTRQQLSHAGLAGFGRVVLVIQGCVSQSLQMSPTNAVNRLLPMDKTAARLGTSGLGNEDAIQNIAVGLDRVKGLWKQ